MKNLLNFDGKNYISSKRASDISGYSTDYIGQLCRAGKLDCRMVGRGWYVTRESVRAHQAQVLISETSPERIKNITASAKKVQPAVARVAEPALDKSEPETATVAGPADAPKVPLGILYEQDLRSLLPTINKETAKITTEQAKISVSVIAPDAVEEYLPKAIAIDPVESLEEPKHEPAAETPSSIENSIHKLHLAEPIERVLIKEAKAIEKVVVPFYQRTVVLKRALGTSMFSLSMILATFIYTAPPELLSSVVDSDHLPRLIAAFPEKFFGSFSRGVDLSGAQMAAVGSLASEEKEAEVPWNGIAVAPSKGVNEDEITKKRIQASFSDEVNVNVDESGTAGVITPVFRKSTSTDFVYVLVPVKDKRVNP